MAEKRRRSKCYNYCIYLLKYLLIYFFMIKNERYYYNLAWYYSVHAEFL